MYPSLLSLFCFITLPAALVVVYMWNFHKLPRWAQLAVPLGAVLILFMWFLLLFLLSPTPYVAPCHC